MQKPMATAVWIMMPTLSLIFATTPAPGQKPGFAPSQNRVIPSAGVGSSSGDPRPTAKQARHLRKLKAQVLFSQQAGVKVTMLDGSQFIGRVGQVADAGFTLIPAPTLRESKRVAQWPQGPSASPAVAARTLTYTDVKSIAPAWGSMVSSPPKAFGIGFMCGMMAPILPLGFAAMLLGAD